MQPAAIPLSIDAPAFVAPDSLTWYRAVTLAERLRTRQSASDDSAAPVEDSYRNDDERLKFCIASWKSQRPFNDPEEFQRRLSLDNLTERDLRHLLTESVDAIRNRLGSPPAWVEIIEAALSQTPTFEFYDFLPPKLQNDPTTRFLDVAAPFVNLGLRQLETGAARLAQRVTHCPFDPAAVGRMLLSDLAHALLQMVGRTMVLELNVARLEGILTGATSEERFASFTAQFWDPTRLRAFFEEYPVLARLIAEQTTRWVTVSLELLERLSADFDALRSVFGGGQALGSLVDISAGLSDPHDGGRSVAIVRFGSGTRVVYKPKPVTVDVHFQDVLRWLTAEGFTPGFRSLTIMDRDSYGWAEFASAKACLTPDEVTRFYERTGGCLALLHALDATDLHASNLIASGEHPVLIDLEALFHPHRSMPSTDAHESADRIAARSLRYSVLRIGLLPERIWGNSEHDGMDISGLGASEGQMTPHPVAAWEESGTDTMRLVRKRKTSERNLNRPILDGQPVDVLAHDSAILRGFRSAYAILAARRNALLSPEGHIARFVRDPISVFLRPSRTYRRLLRESYHPDVLRDALDRDRLFDLLWVEVPDDRELTRVVRSEQRQLWNGDIPRFMTHPGSRDLWSGDGECLAEFLPEPSVSVVHRIVDRMDAPDCSRQAWYIEASLASLPASSRSWPSYPPVRPASIDRDRLLSAAMRVGARLEQLASRGANDASWVGLVQRGRFWSIRRAGLDLDAGTPGIALFLAYLGAVTGDEAASALARAALTTMRSSLTERAPTLTRIGAFDGLGGLIYVLSHLAALWGRPDLVTEADALASRLPQLIAADDDCDVFGGAAGCILALRSLHQCLPSDRLAAVAVQCGDHLLRTCQRTDGIEWPRARGKRRRSAGLAFGDEGIAYALLELHQWTGIERFRTVGLDAQKATVEQQRLGDSLEHTHGEETWTTWCQGTGRIGLSRLCCSVSRTRDPISRADILAVADAIQERGFGWNHSLCHGDFGSLEFLARAAIVLDDDNLARQVRHRAAGILGAVEQHCRCGTPGGVETPGFLAGLAGIGYGLLRTARPDVVPSVLTLDPPPLSRRSCVAPVSIFGDIGK